MVVGSAWGEEGWVHRKTKFANPGSPGQAPSNMATQRLVLPEMARASQAKSKRQGDH